MWQKLAFATRYGHLSIGEVASLDLHDLADYLEQLAEILKQENKAPPRGRRR